VTNYEGPRGTRREEYGKVMELVEGIFVRASERGTNMENGFPLLFNANNLENMRIFLLDGKPVAHIGLSIAEATLHGCRLKIGMVGAVGTDPMHRGRGLGGRLLSDCMSKLLADGVDFVMVSGIRSLYDRAGCVMAGKAYAYDMTAENMEKVLDDIRLACRIREYEPSRIGELIAIYEAESVRYLRTRDEFMTLLDERTYARPKTFLIELGGEAVAYVCIETRWGDEGACWIEEYAGSRDAIIAAVPQLLERLGLKVLRITAPHHDFELMGALAHMGRPRASGFGGTMRVINPRGFLEKLKPHLSARLGESARGITYAVKGGGPAISLGREVVEFGDERDLTWMLFGQPELYEERFGQFMRPPSIEFGGDLERKLANAFPLPTFLYNLNYA